MAHRNQKYPKLTQVGAWRNGSMIGHYTDQTFDDIRYGGFYTQEDIKEIVAYAKERHITIVPEIEMPGHALAALASYPEFSCTGGPFEVGKRGCFKMFLPKRRNVYFLENILTEVIGYFHLNTFILVVMNVQKYVGKVVRIVKRESKMKT